MRVIFLIIFLFLLNCLSAQTNLTVLDSISEEPVAYAEIYFKKQRQLTDSLGQFVFDTPFRGTVTVSCLGYHTVTMRLNAQNEGTIFLKPKPTQLQDVVVGLPRETVEYGFVQTRKTFLPKRDSKVNNDFYPAVYIRNPAPEKESLIKSVKAYIKTKDRDEKAQIRLHIYRFDSVTNTIENEILQKNYVFQVGHQPGSKTFDVEEQQLKLPKKGILVAFQLLNNAKSLFVRIGRDRNLKRNLSFLVPGFEKPEVRTRKVRPLFKITYPLMIGITVYED